MQRININSLCQFILTERGARILNAKTARIDKITNTLDADNRIYEAGDVVQMQLWEIMEVFGKYISLTQQPFCVSCEISLVNDPVSKCYRWFIRNFHNENRGADHVVVSNNNKTTIEKLTDELKRYLDV